MVGFGRLEGLGEREIGKVKVSRAISSLPEREGLAMEAVAMAA